MTGLLTYLLFPAILGANVVHGTEPHTMRLDYYHTGNAATEMFSIEQLVREPLVWPGNPAKRIDETQRGKYTFEIIAIESGQTMYSRGFSSVYGEWETTGEARELNRTFHESLRFPEPQSPFEVVVRKRDSSNQFQEIWRIQLDPTDFLVHQESAPYLDQVTPIEYNGDPASKVDLLLLGDGYTADEKEDFLEKAREMAEALFASEPFKSRRDDFNVWALAPAATISGISRPSTGIYRDSPLGTSYDAFRSRRYVLTYENKAMRRVASSAPYEFIEILTNSETYGGGGIYGLYGTTAANSDWAEYVFVHEFGHHFAGLADEYYTSSVAYEMPDKISEPYEPNVTALLDPDELKWKHLVDPDTPLPTSWPKSAYDQHSRMIQARRDQMRQENVSEAEMNKLFADEQDAIEGIFSKAEFRDAIGAFEGGNYMSEGIYRSELNCIMFTRTIDFCTVCSNSIEQVIDEYTSD